MNPISNLSGDNLFRKPERASVSPRYGVPFVLRTGESPPPTDDRLVTDTIPPLIVDAEADHGPWVVDEVTRILAEVTLRERAEPELTSEDIERAHAWSAARMREIEAKTRLATFNFDLEFDPQLEQWAHEWWEMRRPAVPSPRPRVVKEEAS